MKKILASLLALLLTGASALAQSNVRPIYDNTPKSGSTTQPVDSGTHGLPVQVIGGSAPVGTITWGAITSVTLDGSSDTLRGAVANCTGIVINNPASNHTIYIDLHGGTASATSGLPIPAGQYLSIVGPATPCNAITVIGTNTETVYVTPGT